MAKLPKYNSIRLFNKLAKIAREEFIAQGKEAKWNDIQKWTSKNLFQEFKGTNHNKLDKGKVLDRVKEIIKPIKKLSNCFSPLLINKADTDDIEWWDIGNTLNILPNNVKVRINGGDFGITKIDKASNISYDNDINPIINDLRDFIEKSKLYPKWFGYVRIDPNEKDDGEPCSYFMEFILDFEDGTLPEDEVSTTVSPTTKEDVERIQRIKDVEREKSRKKRERLKKAKTRKRPTTTKKVETKKKKTTPKKTTPKKDKKINKNVTIDLNKELDALRQDVKDGLLTKKEYREERAKLIDKFEKGGLV
jgi:hypothetical protein